MTVPLTSPPPTNSEKIIFYATVSQPRPCHPSPSQREKQSENLHVGTLIGSPVGVIVGSEFQVNSLNGRRGRRARGFGLQSYKKER